VAHSWSFGRNKLVNKRRSEIQIIAEILDLSKNGAKKTEILYQNNMSFLQLQGYLSFLIEKNIIEEGSVTNGNGIAAKVYFTTNKGNQLLEDINKLLTYFE
jgi:predicted transcriptional regulator